MGHQDAEVWRSPQAAAKTTPAAMSAPLLSLISLLLLFPPLLAGNIEPQSISTALPARTGGIVHYLKDVHELDQAQSKWRSQVTHAGEMATSARSEQSAEIVPAIAILEGFRASPSPRAPACFPFASPECHRRQGAQSVCSGHHQALRREQAVDDAISHTNMPQRTASQAKPCPKRTCLTGRTLTASRGRRRKYRSSPAGSCLASCCFALGRWRSASLRGRHGSVYSFRSCSRLPRHSLSALLETILPTGLF